MSETPEETPTEATEAAEETPAAEAEEPTVVEETTPEAPAAEEAAAEEAAALESVTEVEAAVQPEPALEPARVSEPKKPRKRLPRTERHKHSKPVRERAAKRKAITRIEKPESEPGRRQERRGIVVSDKGEKTIVVKVEMIRAHPKYKKVVRRSRKFHAHDEQNAAGVGDVVRIVETRPLSKTKNWRLAEIVEKAR
jgi:small subunit ribosomal protein S17